MNVLKPKAKKNKGTTEKNNPVAEKAVVTLSEIKVPVPAVISTAASKTSKIDRKLIHITTDHLYVASLMNLRAAYYELETIWKKKNDQRAKSALDRVDGLIDETIATIDAIAAEVDILPTVAELDEVMEILKTELESAELLKIMDTDIPKEKMN